jgi:hypothetical protein
MSMNVRLQPDMPILPNTFEITEPHPGHRAYRLGASLRDALRPLSLPRPSHKFRLLR